MNDQKKIGAFIAQARERQGIPRETLARRLQVSEAEIVDWEAGNTYPALSQAPALARELSISLDELFNARYHAVAEAYHASKEVFLPGDPPVESEKTAEEPLEENDFPEAETPSSEKLPTRMQAPRGAIVFYGICLFTEGVTGCLWLLLSQVWTAFFLLASAAGALCIVACLYRISPEKHKGVLLLPLPCLLLLLVVWGIRLCG